MKARKTALLADAPGVKLGLRERKKIEKEHAIRTAARALFTAKGYDATTLREVAERADVGFGTVFAYAHDKAGLLAMLFVDDLKELSLPFTGAVENGAILDQIVEAFQVLHEFWAINPALSRIVLPQMEFYQPNPFAETILQRRTALKSDLAHWLQRAKSAGRLHKHVDPAQASQTIFAIYTSSLREWILAESPKVSAGTGRLRYLLQIPVGAIVKS